MMIYWPKQTTTTANNAIVFWVICCRFVSLYNIICSKRGARPWPAKKGCEQVISTLNCHLNTSSCEDSSAFQSFDVLSGATPSDAMVGTHCSKKMKNEKNGGNILT